MPWSGSVGTGSDAARRSGSNKGIRMPKRITRRSVLATAGASVVAGSAVAAQRSRFVHAGGSSGSPPPGGNPFIQLPVTPGSGRTDSVAAGAQITVGPTSLTLRELGRLAIAGNTQTHTISIYGARNQPPITSVVVDTSGAPPGTFVYTPVSSTIVLWSGFTYYILSTEGTGDSWYDDNQTYTTTSDATLTNSCYFNTSANEILAGTGGANHSYVPVNFKYDLGAPGGITLSGSLWSAFPGDSV